MKRKKKCSRSQILARRRAADLRRAKRKQYRCRTNYEYRKQVDQEYHRRYKAVKQYQYLKNQADISESQAANDVAVRFKVSVSTIRRWHRLYTKEGAKALRPKPSGPKAVVKRIPEEVVTLILAVRAIYNWGAQRIARTFKEQQLGSFSHMFVHRLFHKHHVPVKTYHPRAKREGINYKRYQKRAGNQQWHIDFKGPISIGPLKVWIFVVIDDATRFCLSAEVIRSCSTQTVIDKLGTLFQQYGKPERICTDNGRAFTSIWEDGHHRFEQFLDQQQIIHDLITPFYPQSNGKVEALIAIICRECLTWYLATRKQNEFKSIQELQQALDDFRQYYNWFRGHSALGYRPPGSAYAGYLPKQTKLGALPDINLLIPKHPLLIGNSKEIPPKVDEKFRKQHLALACLKEAA